MPRGSASAQRLAVVGLAGLGVEAVGMGRNVAEQMQSVGGVPRVRWRILERAIGQSPRVVESAEQQSGASQPVIVHARLVDGSTRCHAVEELLAFPQTAQRFARLPELSKHQG